MLRHFLVSIWASATRSSYNPPPLLLRSLKILLVAARGPMTVHWIVGGAITLAHWETDRGVSGGHRPPFPFLVLARKNGIFEHLAWLFVIDTLCGGLCMRVPDLLPVPQGQDVGRHIDPVRLNVSHIYPRARARRHPTCALHRRLLPGAGRRDPYCVPQSGSPEQHPDFPDRDGYLKNLSKSSPIGVGGGKHACLPLEASSVKIFSMLFPGQTDGRMLPGRSAGY